MATIYGTSGDDPSLNGTAGADLIFGEEGHDDLFGLGGDDVLVGGAGDDAMAGGAGSDFADYAYEDGSVEVDLFNFTAEGTHSGFDLLLDIENVRGTELNDVIRGDEFFNFLDGHDGDDTLYGADGDDGLRGGLGNDRLFGGVLFNVNDPIAVVDFDYVDYRDAANGVVVDLAHGIAYGGAAAGNDFLHGVEAGFGSAFADVFYGGSGAQFEAFAPGAGNDHVFGDGHTNTRVEYWNATAGVNVVLFDDGTGLATGGSGMDFLSSVNFVQGSAFDDVFNAALFQNGPNGAFNQFQGDAGDDIVVGNGQTRIDYRSALTGVVVDLANGTATDGLGGVDTFVGVNIARGSNFGDSLYGGAAWFDNPAYEGFEGRGGNDRIYGGAGFDEAIYANDGGVTIGLTIDMAAGTVVGDALLTGTDWLHSVESVRGSILADVYNAAGYAGGDASPFHVGAATSETFNNFEGAAGNDTAIGNGETRLSYSQAESGVVAAFTGEGVGTVSGDASVGVDTFSGVAAIQGSRFDDVLLGSDADDDDGEYVEFFQGGAGDDLINGGDGLDAAIYSDATGGVVVNVADGTAWGDGVGEDVLLNIEGAIGSNYEDTLSGQSGGDGLGGGDDPAGTFYFAGMGNDDVIIGGDGFDMAVYEFDPDGVEVDLHNETYDVGFGIDGYGFLDTLFDIEGVVGSNFDDSIRGSELDNLLEGLDGADTVFGRGGDDEIDGDDGDDSLFGGDGDDEIDGDAGLDSVYGGAGDDVLYGAAGVDSLFGEDDQDLLFGGDAGDFLAGGAGRDRIIGGAGSDLAYGGDGDDTFHAVVGGDTYYGGDTAYGVPGDDFVSYLGNASGVNANLSTGSVSAAGAPTDRLFDIDSLEGSNLADVLIGGSFGATLYGAGGADTVSSQNTTDQDLLYGGAGNDTVTAASEVGVLYGDAGDDSLTVAHGGDGGSHTLYGGDGNDRLSGDGGQDLLYGGANNDILYGGAGVDTQYGGLGDDQYYVHDLDDVVSEFAGGGSDVVHVATSAWTLNEGAGVELVTVAAGFGATVVGDVLSNVIRGAALADSLFGAGGADSLYGSAGMDLLDGGAGADSMAGGADADVYHVDNLNDRIDETAAGSGGHDTAHVSTTNYTVSVGVEVVYAENGGRTIVAAGATDNTMYGDEANDRLDAGDGVDTVLAGSGADIVFGGAGADSLYGGDGNDILYGGLGADLMSGGAGNDRFYVDHLSDVLNESSLAGGGTDTVFVSINDYHVAAGVERILVAGALGLTITADGTFDNMMYGGDGGDRLDGGGGHDRLFGGAGIDSLFGASGNDSLDGGLGSDSLFGGLGMDLLDGDVGADFMAGGAGNDRYIVDDVDDTIDEISAGSDGFDSVYVSVNDYTVGIGVEAIYVSNPVGLTVWTAGAGDHQFFGGTGDDHLDGGDGNDRIAGGAGVDRLTGGAGNDTLSGGVGDDTMRGSAGNDILNGDAGSDTMEGGAGNDRYIVDDAGDVIDETTAGSSGTDTVQVYATDYTVAAGVEVIAAAGAAAALGATIVAAGPTDNLVQGLGGADNLDGGDGNDRLYGAGGSDVVAGGAGNDSLFGGLGVDSLFGGEGGDIVDGGVGADAMAGGGGSDRYFVDDVGDAIDETSAGSGGTDTATVSVNDYTVGEGVEFIRIAGPVGLTVTAAGATDNLMYGFNHGDYLDAGAGVDRLFGGGGGDYLAGQDGVDSLFGGLADDYLFGGNDADILDGGAGADTMTGGDGADRYYVDDEGDVIVEDSGATGLDSVFVGVSDFDVVEGVEWIRVTAVGATIVAEGVTDNFIYGGGGADDLFGGDGLDRLFGGAGNDYLDAGPGVSTLNGGDGADYFVHADGDGNAVIQDFDATEGDRVLLIGVDIATMNGHIVTLTDGAVIRGQVGQVWMQGDFEYGGQFSP